MYKRCERCEQFVNDDADENDVIDKCRINNKKTIASKSFECKKKIAGSTLNNNSRLDIKAVVSVKYLSNF